MKFLLLLLLFITSFAFAQNPIVNFNGAGEQIVRLDSDGNALDAHDGEIVQVGDTFYLYGTSYGCGFEWQNKTASFCGFKVYSSSDLVNWKDRGFLFDATSDMWQKRCDGKTYGCFRPHVVYNKFTRKYVLWINVYDNVSGFRVFTSNSPVGPFVEQAEPQLSTNKDASVAGLNNGDHDTFVDDNGQAYVAFTDWRKGGSIVIERLDSTYLTGSGIYYSRVTDSRTEAPSLFKRKGVYYLTYSDPNCGYCAGTGTSYKWALSPMGPWSEGIKISQNSCGGQPAFVSVIKTATDTLCIYASDLWNNAAKNEAMANFYWAPLEFEANGDIKPMPCLPQFELAEEKVKPGNKFIQKFAGDKQYSRHSDISKSLSRSQTFTANSAGALNSLKFVSFKTGAGANNLKVEIREMKEGRPFGQALYSTTVNSLSWSPEMVEVTPKIQLKKGVQYVFTLSTIDTEGTFGFLYNDKGLLPDETEMVSKDGGVTYQVEEKRSLKFDVGSTR